MGMNDGQVSIGKNEITLKNNDLRYGTFIIPWKDPDKKAFVRAIHEVQQGILHDENKGVTMEVETGNPEFPKMTMLILGVKAPGIPPTIALNITMAPSIVSAKETMNYSVAMSVDAVDTLKRVLGDDRITYKS